MGLPAHLSRADPCAAPLVDHHKQILQNPASKPAALVTRFKR
jgi:hypothetical protein